MNLENLNSVHCSTLLCNSTMNVSMGTHFDSYNILVLNCDGGLQLSNAVVPETNYYLNSLYNHLLGNVENTFG